MKKIYTLLLVLLIILTASILRPEVKDIEVPSDEWFSAVGEFSGEPYVEVNGNVPFFFCLVWYFFPLF